MMRGARLCHALLVCLLAIGSPAAAQSDSLVMVGQPTRWRLPSAGASIPGLGGARFGMARAEVVETIAADFSPAIARMLATDKEASSGDRDVMTVTFPWLTDAVPARLAYNFFGGKLGRVDAEWAIPTGATAAQRAKLVATAQGIVANLYEANWNALTARRGSRIGDDAVLVFAGEDALGRGVEVLLFGVDLGAGTGDGAMLRVSYSADIFGRAAFRAADYAACDAGAVRGFRGARLGATRAEVLTAFALAFPGLPAPQEAPSPSPDTKALQAMLLRLNPGPGPANLAYLFDARTDRLTQINIGWSSPETPADDERLAIAVAASRLQAALDTTAPGCPSSRGGVVDPHRLVMFHAADTAENFVELVAEGIRFQGDGQPGPAPTGRATLRLTYSTR